MPGRVELMQHRKIYEDDGRGMGESLTENDDHGNPISVPAQYFVQ